MAANNYQVPDLASILRTLAALAPEQQNVTAASVPLPAQLHPPVQLHQPAHQVASPALDPAGATAKKTMDPSSIIDWPSGLRCVMKTVAANENILREIRRMMTVQREHEAQWWQGRLALVHRQSARKEGQKKLDAVLEAVGGAITSAETKSSGSEEEANELKTFDLKVYRAQHQMVKEMSAKLRSLGIPFFGTRAEFIRAPSKDTDQNDKSERTLKGTITEKELVELQRKMLDLLEEMCDGGDVR